ncbi:MAG TPA: cytochrome c3 family protein, partial [Burkholderiales bacterium]|nr:cytochrome c3 family protein [Burkholderiales bacterium]
MSWIKRADKLFSSMSKRGQKSRPGASARLSSSSGRKIALAGLGVAIVAGAALIWHAQTPSGPRPESAALGASQFAGSVACAGCHAAQTSAWSGSHHQLAMQEASASSVLGDFDDAKYQYLGVESRFFRRDGKFMVRTDGPDGKLADFEIKYSFGVTPLQQYLIEFPGGRLQALSIAWDTRPKSAGGQRWFHLYPGERITHEDPLHWTGLYQNWNLQCAACHSTNLKKGYDAAGDTYRTTFSEINVACEACHGPGSRHVAWARRDRPQGDKGLVKATMNVCAACHARRSTISEEGQPGAPLEDTHRLALLTSPSYHADGQQREEDYTWGSFLQSKMFQRGVTCMDCHEPHALKLRVEGNALCVRCHDGAVFDTAKHHFHEAGTKGAQCVECHMPAQNYMVVDPRRDHSMRIPRPDLSASLDSPNACTQCHAGRKPEWAAAAMDQRYGKKWRDRWHYGATLHAGATQGVKALPALLALAEDPAAPPIVQATAVALAQPHVRPGDLPAARRLLTSAD